LGMALCNKIDADGHRDATALAEAEIAFARARQISLEIGRVSAVAANAPYWAISIELARGRASDALRRLDEALALVGHRPRRWGYVMAFRIWVAAELGDDDLCRRS